MKKRSFIIIVFLLIISALLCSLSACNPAKLDTPTGLMLDGNLLTWNNVPNADGYIVSINDLEYRVSTNQYYILVLTDEEYMVTVRAISDSKKHIESDSSASIVYTKKDPVSPELLPRLSAPINLTLHGGVLTWDAVFNSTGYRLKIEKPDKTIEYQDVTERSWSLIGGIDGFYYVSVMAKANLETHRNSLYSSRISYEIDGVVVKKGLNVPLQITYSQGKLRWSRVAFAVGYIIIIDGEEVYTINDGNTISYELGLNEKKTHVVRIKAKGDGTNYKDSEMSKAISFPRPVNSPPNNIMISAGKLVWDLNPDAKGYKVSINDIELDEITENSVDLDFSMNGLNVIKVKSIGDDIYYTDSPYSAEIGYMANNGNPVPIPLTAPENLLIGSNDILQWDSVLLAQGYEFIYDEDFSTQIENTKTDLSFLERGVHSLAVRAVGDGIYTSNSPLSKQLFYFKGVEQATVLSAPVNINLNNGILEWHSVLNATGYDVKINDFDIVRVTQSILPSNHYSMDGRYTIKVKAIGDNKDYLDSPYSAEFLLEKPTMLQIPADVTLLDRKLSWTRVNGAATYRIEIKGESGPQYFHTQLTEYDIDLEEDGDYIIRIKAIGDNDFYSDSLYSQEVSYRKQDGNFGGRENPYLIESIENLTLVRDNPSSYFKLTADLDLTDIEFEPLCSFSSPFTGYFDGDGHTLSNINISGTHSYAGIFGYIYNGTVINLNIDNITININNYVEPFEPEPEEGEEGSAYVPGYVYAGAIAGYGRNADISGVKITSAVIELRSNSIYAGIAGGYFSGIYKDIEGAGSITASSDGTSIAGGFAGYFNGRSENINVGSADSAVVINNRSDNISYTGGFAGRLYGTLSDKLTVFAEISVTDSENLFAGGIAGSLNAETLKDSNVKAAIEVNGKYIVRVGGVAGFASTALIDTVVAEGTIISLSETVYAGGITGEIQNSDILEFSAKFTITATADNIWSGGIAGYGDADISKSNSEVNMTLTSAKDVKAGGIAAELIGSLSECTVTAIIKVNENADSLYAGGAVGKHLGDLSQITVNSISIEALNINKDIYAGGAVGYQHEGDIDNLTVTAAALNLSSKTGGIYTGGVAGIYLLGAVRGTNVLNADIDASGIRMVYAGGIAGYCNGVINDAKSNIDINIVSSNDSVYAGGIAGVSNELVSIAEAAGIINAEGAGVFAGGISGMSTDLSEVKFNGSINGKTVVYVGEEAAEGVFAAEEEFNEEEGPSETECKLHIFIGGIAGYISGDIDDAEAVVGSITGQSVRGSVYAGGIAGKHINGTNTKLFANSTGNRLIRAIAYENAYSGGIAGMSGAVYEALLDNEGNPLVSSAIADVDVKAEGLLKSYAGSFAGYFTGIADRIMTSGKAEALSEDAEVFAGGVAGYMESATVNNASSSSDVIAKTVNADAYSGGISGRTDNAAISGSYYDGTLTSEGAVTYTGGISGKTNGNIITSYSVAIYNYAASDTSYLGGITGCLSQGYINKCYSIFNIDISTNNIKSYTGGIVGYIGFADIVNTYSVCDITAAYIENDDYLGGLGGFNDQGNIISSYVTGGMTAAGADKSFAGKFLGANNSKLEKCVYDKLMLGGLGGVGNGSIIGLDEKIMGAYSTAQGFEGWDGENSWEFADCYYPRLKGLMGQQSPTEASIGITEISLSPNSEILDLSKLLNFTFGAGAIFKGAYFSTESNPYLKVSADGMIDLYDNTPLNESIAVTILFEGNVSLTVNVIAFNITTISGLGTAESPYLISSSEWMKYLSFRPDAHFKMTNDIDMTGIIWEPVGSKTSPFTGVFDGDNRTITGLRNPKICQNIGLFGYTEGAVIKNLNLQGIALDSESPYGAINAGSLIGYALNTEIDNITASGTLKAKAMSGVISAGGIVGYAENALISNISSLITLDIWSSSPESFIGGIAGYLTGGISDSYYKSTIDAYTLYGSVSLGGLIGQAMGTAIDRCYAAPCINMNSNDSYVLSGGLVGYISTIYGEQVVESTVSDCYASAEIEIINAMPMGYTGGLIGYNEANITRSISSVISLKGLNMSGAFSGNNFGTLTDCYFYKYDSFDSKGIVSGNVDRLKGVTADFLMSGEEIEGWENWTFALDTFPRLAGLNGQDDVTSVTIGDSITVDSPDYMINLLDYIDYSIDYNAIFSPIKISVPDATKLAIIDGSFVMVMGEGAEVLTLTFDGGFVKTVNVTISNIKEPLFNKGRGTQADPFMISTAEHFDNVRQFKYLYYKLNNDIDLTGIVWISIGSEEAPFTGGFDGNGYAINNLTGESLFGYIDGAKIKNLALNNATVTVENSDFAGLLALKAKDSTVTNCSTDNLSQLSSSAIYYGGLVGWLFNSTMVGCISNMEISLDADVQRNIGGLVGRADNSTADNCKMWGSMEINVSNDITYLGGLIGYAYNTKIMNCIMTNLTINAGIADGAAYIGGFVGYAFLVNINDCSLDVDFIVAGDANELMGEAFIGGAIGEGNNSSVDTLTMDFNLTLTGEDIAAAGGIVGDSRNNTIDNINVTFVSDINITNIINIGGIIGNNAADITNAIVDLTITHNSTKGALIGGISGQFSGSADNVALTVAITANADTGNIYAGGFTGLNYGNITNSEAAGALNITALTGSIRAGGAAGVNERELVSAASSVDINASISIDELQDITVKSQDILVGGLIGSNNNTVFKCVSTGSVNVGYNLSGKVNYTEDAEEGTISVGGLIGINEGEVSYSSTLSNVDLIYELATTAVISGKTIIRNSYLGGNTGYNGGNINNCYCLNIVKSEVSGSNLYAGGFAGYNYGATERTIIMSCYSASSLYTKFDSVNYPALECYMGGFVGYAYGELHEDVNIEIEGEIYVVDMYTGQIISCFYDTDTIDDNMPSGFAAPSAFAGGCTSAIDLLIESSGKTTAELQTETTYPEQITLTVGEYSVTNEVWKRTEWNIADGNYPVFIWQI